METQESTEGCGKRMKTYASLFTGFGGADLGAMAAGLQPVWGVEYDAEIAEVGNANLGQHIKVANILDCKPTDFERVDVLHASPPCPNFSVAKAGGVETAHDLAMAKRVAEFVTALQPQVFTLENVQAYRKSRSWHIINEALNNAGYWLNIEIVNSADMGVPQTRKRMIVRSIRGGFVPYLPQSVPWVGWYAAIEDMLDTLPESQFAPWQLARLPEELKRSILFANTGGHDSYGDHHVEGDQPSGAITTQSLGRAKAFLINGDNASRDCSARTITEPTFTVTDGRKHPLKAFIVDCQNGHSKSSDLTIRNGDQPCFTLTSSMGQKRPTRAFDGGRVVAMTPRALARFQSFPDSYMLPDSKTLAAKGIGNAVPPLMYQKVIEGLLS